jgi:multicomponent Na+:H+ antiporter subunit F
VFLFLVIVVMISLCLVLVRSLLGPTIYDRVLAVNSAGTKVVLLIAAYGFLTNRPDFVDISLLYALINYIGTIAVLKFFDTENLGSGSYKEDDI